MSRSTQPDERERSALSYLAALAGVAERLARGAKVADVDCGDGAATIDLARAYPRSRFFAFDPRAPSLDRARAAADAAGVADRVSFDLAAAADLPGRAYDLILHRGAVADLPRAARRAREALIDRGSWVAWAIDPRLEGRLAALASLAGFTRVRVHATAAGRVLEARP